MITSNTFCTIPFISLMVDSTQKIQYCCIAKGPGALIHLENGKIPYAGVDSLANAWNSPTMVDIRKKMVNGEKVDACSNCYYKESLGKPSNREYSIREWKWRLGEEQFNELIQNTIDNDCVSPTAPIYLDLRLGNLCNLKCRMCNPWNSSQIAKEHFELYDSNEDYKNLWIKHLKRNPIELKLENNWYESDMLWDEIISFLPTLEKVYMTGGEPTLIESNLRFMQTCIDLGYADKLVLFFNINCTNINPKFLKLLTQFKNVIINASIDGVAETNEYIRYPSNWKQLDKNLNLLAGLKNIELNFSPTLTLYNVLECDNIIHYVKDLSLKHSRRIGIDYLFNSGVSVFNSTLLTVEDRAEVAERIKLLLDDPWIKEHKLSHGSIQGLVGILTSPQDQEADVHIADFLKITQIYDKSRNQLFANTFPKLASILNE